MRNRTVNKIYCFSSQLTGLRKSCYSFSSLSRCIHSLRTQNPGKAASFYGSFKTTTICMSLNPNCSISLRYLTSEARKESTSDASNEEVEPIELWEEEDEIEPEIGDGGDGGGIVLRNCPWGERALSIAQEVLRQLGDDIELFAFKTSHRGYIYVRLDKLSNEYGCPSMDEIESFSRDYKKKLEEEIPDDDLALEVSSPGADRLLRVPDDFVRFQDMAMVVRYLEDSDSKSLEKEGVFFFDSIETESESCSWKLADVKENRDPSAKGRPMSRKQKDWRLKLAFASIKRVTLYISY